MALTFKTNTQEKKTDDRYMKFKDGENKFRIIDSTSAIEGWELWEDKKPTRLRETESKPKGSKGFFAFQVWDYQKSKLGVLVITQSGIKKSLEAFSDLADLSSFDIVVTRTANGTRVDDKTGEELPNIKYETRAEKPKALAQSIKDLAKNEPVNLEALFEGEDPWALSQESDNQVWEELEFALIEDGLIIDALPDFIGKLALDNSKTKNQVVKQALLSGEYDKFKTIFAKFTKQQLAS